MGYKEELARTRQLTADLGSGNRKQNFIADILDIGNKEFNPNDPSDLAKPMDKNLALLDDTLFGGRFQKYRRDLYLDKRKPQIELQVQEKDFKAEREQPGIFKRTEQRMRFEDEIRKDLRIKEEKRLAKLEKINKGKNRVIDNNLAHQTFIENQLPQITSMLDSRIYGSNSYKFDLIKDLSQVGKPNSFANAQTLNNVLIGKNEDGIRFYDDNTPDQERAGQQSFMFTNDEGKTIFVHRDSNTKSRSLFLKRRNIRNNISEGINNLNIPDDLKTAYKEGTLTNEQRTQLLDNPDVQNIVTQTIQNNKATNLVNNNELFSNALDAEFNIINKSIVAKKGLSTQAENNLIRNSRSNREEVIKRKGILGKYIKDEYGGVIPRGPARKELSREKERELRGYEENVEAATLNEELALEDLNKYREKKAGALLEVAWKQKVQQRVHQLAFRMALQDNIILTKDNAQRYIQRAISRLSEKEDPSLELSREKIILAYQDAKVVPIKLKEPDTTSNQSDEKVKDKVPSENLTKD